VICDHQKKIIFFCPLIVVHLIKPFMSKMTWLFLNVILVVSVTHAEMAAPSFLSMCVELAKLGVGLQCSGSTCRGEEGATLSLHELQRVQCAEDNDCRIKDTSMQCVQGRCDCPFYHAFNVSSCSCQPAAFCPPELEDCTEHNGRRCEDNYCSCFSSPNFSSLLVDPSSLFCVLPGGEDSLVLHGSSGASSLGLAVLGALLGFVCVVVVAVLVVMAYKHCVCEKGDYVCEAPENIPEEHIAAWDHPSLDYINKTDEDIVFTLCQASDNVRMSNASTIYVMDDETSGYDLANHDNMAYVQDEDPRHD